MHELIDNVLADLSFTPEQIIRISQLAKAELSNGLKDTKIVLEGKQQKLKEVKIKIEKLEEN